MKGVVRSAQDNVAWTYGRLVGFAQRLALGLARPGECTAILDSGGYAQHSAQWFMRMARQAVRPKYVRANRAGVVAWLDRADEVLVDPRSALLQGSVRLASHATRWRCGDVDLFACTGHHFDLTPWLFQQADLRYRVHTQTRARLDFMLACWAHYMEYGLTPETAYFGMDAFPLTADLRVDIAL